MKRILMCSSVIAMGLLAAAALQGCAVAAAGAAGATAGYVAHEKGYRVQSPVTKEPNRGDHN